MEEKIKKSVRCWRISTLLKFIEENCAGAPQKLYIARIGIRFIVSNDFADVAGLKKYFIIHTHPTDEE